MAVYTDVTGEDLAAFLDRAGRVLACSQLSEMMNLTRELCGGQLCMTLAYARSPSARGTLVVANLQYTGLIFAAIYGITVFGDELPLIAWVGMLLIVGSGIAATVLRARTGQETPQQER